MALLEVQGLHAGYGETEILHGVRVTVEDGEFVLVIGPNGAGKSTLIKAVIGILKPRKGTIHFRGVDVGGRNPEDLVPRGLAYVPQVRNIFPTLSVLENLELGAVTRRPGWLHRAGEVLLRDRDEDAPPRLSEKEFRERVERIVAIFPNLRGRLRQRAGSLSGGEQQMVALGRALILDPVLLLIDEPSAGLAPKLVSLIFEKIKEINDHGTAILMVEQNAKRALGMADRGYVLEMGRNRFEGTGQALLHDPDVGRLYLGG